MIVSDKLSTNEGNRHPKVKLSTRSPKRKATRKNSNHYARFVVDSDCLPNQAGIASKATLPEPVAQHYDFVVSGLFLFRNERTPEHGFHLEEIEKIRRYARTPHFLRLALPCQVVGPWEPSRH